MKPLKHRLKHPEAPEAPEHFPIEASYARACRVLFMQMLHVLQVLQPTSGDLNKNKHLRLMPAEALFARWLKRIGIMGLRRPILPRLARSRRRPAEPSEAKPKPAAVAINPETPGRGTAPILDRTTVEYLQPSELVPALAATVRAFLRERKKRHARASAKPLVVWEAGELVSIPSRDLSRARQLARDPVLYALRQAIRWIGEVAHHHGGTRTMHEVLNAVIKRNPNLKGRIVSMVDHAWDGIGERSEARTCGSRSHQDHQAEEPVDVRLSVQIPLHSQFSVGLGAPRCRHGATGSSRSITERIRRLSLLTVPSRLEAGSPVLLPILNTALRPRTSVGAFIPRRGFTKRGSGPTPALDA